MFSKTSLYIGKRFAQAQGRTRSALGTADANLEVLKQHCRQLGVKSWRFSIARICTTNLTAADGHRSGKFIVSVEASSFVNHSVSTSVTILIYYASGGKRRYVLEFFAPCNSGTYDERGWVLLQKLPCFGPQNRTLSRS